MFTITTETFSVADEYDALTAGNTVAGAVVFFVGLVRDFNQGNQVQSLYLEHYPEMAEKSLGQLIENARQLWPLERVRVTHRVGKLAINDQIVFVGVSAMHRKAAFAAASFIMDSLKSKVPIWKKERLSNQSERWVEPEQSLEGSQVAPVSTECSAQLIIHPGSR